MYIYKSLIVGSLSLKVAFILTFLSFVIFFAIFLRRISIFNTLSQIILEINGKINKVDLGDICLYEIERVKMLYNPISVFFISTFEEFDRKTSYDIIETKLLRIKNVISQGENNTFEFLNKFQRILFGICSISPLIGIFFLLFSFSDLFVEIGLNGNKEYTFIALKIGEILFIGILTLFTSLTAFILYIFLNYKTISLLKQINNFSLFIFNYFSLEIEKSNPTTIIEKYQTNNIKYEDKKNEEEDDYNEEEEEEEAEEDDEEERNLENNNNKDKFTPNNTAKKSFDDDDVV